MISNSNVGRRGGDKQFDTSIKRGVMEEKGIVIGIVKENAHPVRMGNIKVFIPGRGATGEVLSGAKQSIEDDPTQWRMVRYCTPWYSRTETTSAKNIDSEVKNTAGIIYPAPDIGTKVLCFFPEGKNAEGFWFACAPDPYMMQSLPEPTPTQNFTTNPKTQIQPRGPVPGGEFNDRLNDTKTLKNFGQVERSISNDFYKNLVKQGIDLDLSKGISNSGYMRETPAELIGITTKGRRVDANGVDIKDRSDIVEALQSNNQQSGENTNNLQTIKGLRRTHGHTLILDDGDTLGENQLIRLRSAKGAQFLIHDTEEFVYIINQSGNAWISMDKQGQIDVYSEKNINFRTTNMNFHAEKDIKFHAGNFIDLVSENEVNIQAEKDVSMHSTSTAAFVNAAEGVHINSDGTLNISAGSVTSFDGGSTMSIRAGLIQLQGPTTPATKKTSIPTASAPDTQLTGDFWQEGQSIQTSVDRMPTHEPFPKFDESTEPKPRGNRRSGGGGASVSSLAGGAFSNVPLSSGLTTPIQSGGALGEFGGATSVTGSLSTITSTPLTSGGLTKALNVTGTSGLTDITNTVPGLTSVNSSGGFVQDFGGSNLPIEYPMTSTITSVSSVNGFSTQTLSNSSGVLSKISTTAQSTSSGTLSSNTSFGKLPGLGNIQTAANNGLSNLPSGFDPVKIIKTPEFGNGIGPVDAGSLRGMAAAQTSFVGSGGSPSFVDGATGAVGKYGFTVGNLKDAGYIKPNTVLNSQMLDSRNWTGKGGISSFSNFASNSQVQDNLFAEVSQKNMQSLASAGVIYPNDPTDVVASLTNVANAVGIKNAENLRAGKALQPFPVDGTSTILSAQDVQAKTNQLLAETISATNNSLVANEQQRPLFNQQYSPR